MKLSTESRTDATDRAYLERRKAFAIDIGREDIYSVIDHFALYAGIHTLGSKLFVYDLLASTVDVPGHVMEFGVWKGSNLMFLAKTLSLLSPHSIKRVIGFDNFEGLPDAAAEDGAQAAAQKGAYAGDVDLLKRAIALFDFNGFVQLVPGDANETIPTFARDNPEVMVSFAYIDFDLYEPVKTALTYLEGALSIGGVIAFDEALDGRWPGETVAMKEFLAGSSYRYEMISNPISRQPTVALRRLA